MSGFQNVGGIPDLLKEGTKHIAGVDEAVLKNIEACKQLATLTASSFGPDGMNKLVVNHLEKLFVTSDAATILKETDVVHPAANMVVLAAKSQESENGDGTNFVVMFAGELLVQAESLLRMGLHPSDVVTGYTKASKEALNYLKSLVVHKVTDVTNVAEMTKMLKPVMCTKQSGLEGVMADLVTKACTMVLPRNMKNFNTDNVRLAKILGQNVHNSTVVKGMVIPRDAEGTIKEIKGANVAVFGCGITQGDTETKGTVVLENAQQLMDYNKGEEDAMEKAIKEIAAAGANVVISGSAISEIGLHFIEKYKMLCVKIISKFELRRLCRTIGATALVRLGAPTKEEMGHCSSVSVQEIGDQMVTVFNQEGSDDSGQVATIILRGSTHNLLDDLGRAVDDGVNVFKSVCKEGGEFLAGRGAAEIELARHLVKHGDNSPGLDQYAIKKFGEAFETIPRALAENAGHNATDVLSALYSAHEAGDTAAGVDSEAPSHIVNAKDAGTLDLYATKWSGIRLAAEAAITVMRVDQIIMSRQAGGPAPRGPGPQDIDD